MSDYFEPGYVEDGYLLPPFTGLAHSTEYVEADYLEDGFFLPTGVVLPALPPIPRVARSFQPQSGDIATGWDPEAAGGDWSMADGDLTTDPGLRTAVILSIMTDATAHADDELPVDGDRRGWWGDITLAGERPGDRFGSRLWLLARAKATEETRRRAQLMCREALAWMIEDRIAASVDVLTEWQGDRGDQLAIAITVNRPKPGASARFDLLWTAEGAR